MDHAPIKPAFGYRVDYGGHSVVLSGDTRYNENLIHFAQGADVLIHEVIDPEAFRGGNAVFSPELTQKVIAHHTTAEQAGTIFSQVKPRLAVYSHIVPPNATESGGADPKNLFRTAGSRRRPDEHRNRRQDRGPSNFEIGTQS